MFNRAVQNKFGLSHASLHRLHRESARGNRIRPVRTDERYCLLTFKTIGSLSRDASLLEIFRTFLFHFNYCLKLRMARQGVFSSMPDGLRIMAGKIIYRHIDRKRAPDRLEAQNDAVHLRLPAANYDRNQS